MTYTFWSSNTGGDGPTPDPPGTGNSLRFRGLLSQYMQRTFNTTNGYLPVWTVSYWVKWGDQNNHNSMFGGITTTDGSFPAGATGVNFAANYVIANTRQVTAITAPFDSPIPEFRDYSAWYHYVWSCDGTYLRAYVNGVQYMESSTLSPAQLNWCNSTWNQVGGSCIPSDLGPSYSLDGYLADFYNIDGQVLEPTAFGRYNEDGIWVPREVDFTPAQMRYSDYLTSPDVGFQPPHPPAYAFNGLSSDYCITETNGTWVFAPATPIPVTSTVEVFQFNTAGTTTWNGTTLTPNGGSVTFNGSGEISAANPITGSTVGVGQGCFLNKIIVDGVELVNPYLWSFGVTLVGAGSEGGFASSPYFMFDGTTSTTCQANASNQSIKWVPSTPISYNTKVEYFTPGPANTNLGYLYYQGAELAVVNNLSGEWTTLIEGSGTFDDLRIYGSGVPSQCAAIRIDGQIYIDGASPSYGPNGFHLTFEDPNNLGLDSSGNGNDFTATGFNTIAPVSISGQYADPAQSQAVSGAVGTGGTPSAYLENIVPDNAYGSFQNTPGSWAKIFDGDLGSAPEWYGTQYSLNPLSVDFDLRDFTAAGVTSVEICDKYVDNQRPYDVFLLDSSGAKIAGSDWTSDPALSGQFSTVPVPPGSSPAFIRFSADNTQRILSLAGIRVNGVFLSQNANSNPDYDLMQDGPIQNYATINSISNSPNQTAEKANLQSRAVGATSGKWEQEPTILRFPANIDLYFECSTGYGSGPNWGATSTGFYIANRDLDIPLSNTSSWLGTQRGFVCDLSTNNFANGVDESSSSSNPVVNGTNLGDNAIIGVRVVNNRITITRDGAATNVTNLTLTQSATDTDGFYRIYTYNYYGTSDPNAWTDWNFGQQPFLYQPAGTVPLQTQNLPAADIVDGREHFRAITGPGNGTGVYTTTASMPVDGPFNAATWQYRGTTPFSVQDANFVIDLGGEVTTTNFTYSSASGNIRVLLSIDGITWRQLGPDIGWTTTGTMTWSDGNPFRYVRHWFNAGSSGYTLGLSATTSGVPILSAAQAAYPNGLWWIKSMTNTGQHQLLDSVRGGDLALTLPALGKQAGYGVPGGTCVAWSWNLDANRSNGFDILTWTGDSVDGRQIPHNLDASRPLDMVIVKGYDAPNTSTYIDSANWVTWHNSLEVNGYIYLNLNLTAGTTNSFWTATGPNSVLGNLTIGADPDVNNGPSERGGAIEYAAYLWQSIPGYSAFGKYDGNSNPDGPFIYTGFRPAFVMIKRVTATGNWHVYDTTRSPINIVGETLYPDLDFAEQNVDYLDILSNGFKLRTDDGPVNLGSVYLYAAFAENPFGGSNVSPANAR